MVHDESDGDGSDGGDTVHSTILTGVDDGLELDTVYDLLSDQRRRYALYYLGSHDPVSVDELAGRIAAWEASERESTSAAEIRERVALDLRHTHLPKLRDVGVIEYDRRSETIRHGTPPKLLQAVLKPAIERERPERVK